MTKLPINGDTGPGTVGERPDRLRRVLFLVLVGFAAAALTLGLCTGGQRSAHPAPTRPGSDTPVAAGTTGTITVTGTVGEGLYPGGSRPVTFTAANAGASSVTIGTVSLTELSATAGCSAADFTMPEVLQDFAVPGGARTVALPNQGTLSMANSASNQDACKGSNLTLTLSSTSSRPVTTSRSPVFLHHIYASSPARP